MVRGHAHSQHGEQAVDTAAVDHSDAFPGRDLPRKSGVSTVNEFLSKRFNFSNNSICILIECAQKREQRLQACLIACAMRRHDISRPGPSE